MAGGTGWIYNIPTVYRLTDWNGYDHNAIPWFTLRVDGKNNGAAGDTIRFSLDIDLAWLVENFSSFEGIKNNLQGGVADVGFIVSSQWSSESSLLGTYYYKISDYLDFADDSEKKLNITIPEQQTGDIGNGTYYVVPTITTDTNHIAQRFAFISENNAQAATWYTIPSNPVTIVINYSVPQYDPLTYFYVDFSNVIYETDFDTDVWKRVQFTAKAGFTTGYTGSSGRLIVEFKVDNVYTGGTTTKTYTIGSMSSSSIGGGQSTSKSFDSGKMHFLTDKDGNLWVNIEVSYTVGTKTYRKTLQQEFY